MAARLIDESLTGESTVSSVRWGAVFGGALAAMAITIILMALGSGLGLASVTPWANDGAEAGTMGVMAAIWLVVMQWISSGVGGYLTGRLRTKWVDLHTDEVFFRDTSHGFLTWALSTLIVVALTMSSVSSVVSGGAKMVTDVASSTAKGAAEGAAQSTDMDQSNPADYYIDRLFRSDSAGVNSADQRQEIQRILLKAVSDKQLNPDDRAYLSRMVAQRTGISTAEADARVDDLFRQAQEAEKKAREAADQARKAAMTFSLLTALSFLIGAFISSVAAAMAGRHRDD
ncbi:MAG: hypothetical protein U1E36_06975 [Rickettsiales bacterium]